MRKGAWEGEWRVREREKRERKGGRGECSLHIKNRTVVFAFRFCYLFKRMYTLCIYFGTIITAIVGRYNFP